MRCYGRWGRAESTLRLFACVAMRQHSLLSCATCLAAISWAAGPTCCTPPLFTFMCRLLGCHLLVLLLGCRMAVDVATAPSAQAFADGMWLLLTVFAS